MNSLLFLSIFLATSVTIVPAQINNPNHMIVAKVTEPTTVDPAWEWGYEASMELIGNVYDTLIRYDRESVDEFVPCLATDWGVSEDRLTLWFEIREGVRFHNGDILTTEDVEYSFERWMVQDRNVGPAWMILYALFGVYNTADLGNIDTPAGRTEIATKIDNAVERNSTHVWFNLKTIFVPTIFYQIIAQPFSSILNKQWCINQGDWPGTWTNWISYHDPVVSPLDDPPEMMGTGPYKFDYWDEDVEWSIVKNDNYWQGWPAPGCGGYVERVTFKLIEEWVTRKMMFIAGDCDLCYVPRVHTEEIYGLPGIRSIYPLESLSIWALLFNFEISTTSPYMGVSGGLPPSTIDEAGIPPDFFADVDVRKGFAYCFDYVSYIEETISGEGIQSATCVIKGLPYYNPDQAKYCLDLSKAEEHFRMAWGGQLWNTGFTMGVAYNTGNEARQLACEMLKLYVESLNPRFHIEIFSNDWSIYVSQWVYREIPLFIVGWGFDYPDPHNFVDPFMHSQGGFASWQSYSNSYVDELIEDGVREIDPENRRDIYYELQSIYHDDVPSVPLYQPYGRHWERDWVQGWYYNPTYYGNYYYHLWKGELSSAHEDQILIEEVIDPPSLTTDLIAYRWPEPLVFGDVISPCIYEPGEEYMVNRTKWFYWINDCPYAMFAHETRYVFIDDETGEYEVVEEVWPPSLNGQEMWPTPEEFWNPNNWVYSTLTNLSEPTMSHGTSSLHSLIESRLVPVNPELHIGDRALIIEGHDETGSGRNASELWYNMLLGFGYTDQQITYLAWEDRALTNDICTRENVFNAINTLSDILESGDTLTVYIFAHGKVEDENTLKGYIKLTETGNKRLYDWELNQSLSQIEDGVHINIIMEVCFGGSFIDDLWMLENVDIIITSTDWKSETYFAYFDPPINYRYIVDLTPDPNYEEDEGGEFSSGLVEGLDELKQQHSEVGLLYLKAFNTALERDAGYINRGELATYYKTSEKSPYPLLKMTYYLCDVNHDGRVNILDLATVAYIYGSKSGDENWRPEINVNRDLVINILDLSTVAFEFGKVYYIEEP